MGIISLQDAFEQGETPSTLRTLARGLERIARSDDRHHNFDSATNKRNAYLLRKLATEMELAKEIIG